MDIKSVLKSNGEVTKFYCKALDIYLRVNVCDGVKSLYVSDTLDNIDDIDCPLLENVMPLEDIFNLEVEPVETLTIVDVLKDENIRKTYYSSILNCSFMCTFSSMKDVIRLFVINPITNRLTDDLIEDTFELVDIVNAKFVEVD